MPETYASIYVTRDLCLYLCDTRPADMSKETSIYTTRVYASIYMTRFILSLPLSVSQSVSQSPYATRDLYLCLYLYDTRPVPLSIRQYDNRYNKETYA